MSDETNTGLPKTPRPKHRHSKSAVSVPATGGRQNNPAQSRPDRRHHEHRQATPQWDDVVLSQDSTGDFDSDGNFISGHTMSAAESADIDSPPDKSRINNSSQRNRRKPRTRKESEQNATPQMFSSDIGPPPGKVTDHGQDGGTVPASASTPAKSTAYAGPTFHASPAASSLPIPKFFSKSVPAATSESSLQARLEKEEDDTSDKSESPPQEAAQPSTTTIATNASAAATRNTDSPLDLFFKADREEKSKVNGITVSSTPKSKVASELPQSEPAPANHWFSIYGPDQRRHTRHGSNGSGKDLFMMELDGNSAPTRTPGAPYLDVPASKRAIPTLPSLPHQQSDPYLSQYFAHQSIYGSPNYGKSMPSLAGEASNPSHDVSPSYRPPIAQTPRSAGSSPAPQSNNPYHYGNKNLSPLFQAAKNDPVRRSSSLRQELNTDTTPELPGSPMPDQFRKSSPESPKQLDASAIALDYLRAHVSQQVRAPDGGRSGVVNPRGTHVPTDPHIHPQPPHSIPTGQLPAVSPNRNQNTNVKSMENDLRRLLNLSDSGSNGVAF